MKMMALLRARGAIINENHISIQYQYDTVKVER